MAMKIQCIGYNYNKNNYLRLQNIVLDFENKTENMLRVFANVQDSMTVKTGRETALSF